MINANFSKAEIAMTFAPSEPIFREMLLDLCYRLRLADELLGRTSEALVDALTLEDFAAKRQTTALLAEYAQALQLIYADFHHLVSDCQVTFPPTPALWQWNEPDGDAAITDAIERMHNIAEGMERKLAERLNDHMEVSK